MRAAKKICLVVAMLLAGYPPASASAASLGSTATVVKNCNISATTMAFGTYDPTGSATPPISTITVTCTKGSSNVTVGLDNGSHAGLATCPSGSCTRAMANGTNYLGYDIFTDNNRTLLWSSSTNVSVTGFSTGTVQSVTAYGKAPAGQFVRQGSYSDTVTATVNY